MNNQANTRESTSSIRQGKNCSIIHPHRDSTPTWEKVATFLIINLEIDKRNPKIAIKNNHYILNVKNKKK